MLKNIRYNTAQTKLKRSLKNHRPRLSASVQSIGVLTDAQVNIDEKELKKIFGHRDIAFNRLLWKPDGDISSESQAHFSPGDLKNWGKFKTGTHAEDFTSKTYDLLINFWQKPNFHLLYAAAFTSAKFKTGIPNPEKSLNDLEINVDKNDFYKFCKELNKYLNAIQYE